MTLQHSIKIGMVAGELSGDLLGAGLISALKKRYQLVEFVGIGGPAMIKEGIQSLISIEKLSVMGISDVLMRYFELRNIYKNLLNEFKRNPPDIFIGINFSSFNISLAGDLKKQGIKTIQYVSPQIWAWRQKRVFKIKKAVDLVLTLFPFEKVFYDQYKVPAIFVGHPLADYIDLNVESLPIKQQLGYTAKDKVIAVLPGSRMGELKYMGPLFLDVMHQLSLKHNNIHFIVPTANQRLRQIFEDQMKKRGYHLNVQVTDGKSREAMAASDLIILKSGTATLEAMLLKRPMVVAYKGSAVTKAIVVPQLKTRFIALPNLLADQLIVPEFLQNDATSTAIVEAVLALLGKDTDQANKIKPQFDIIHNQLRQNANETAAQAVLDLIKVK